MREGKGLAQVFVEDRRRSEALAFFQVRKARCGLDGLQSNRIKQLALPLCPRDIVSACMHICIHAVHADVSCIRWVDRDEGRRGRESMLHMHARESGVGGGIETERGGRPAELCDLHNALPCLSRKNGAASRIEARSN